jgi:hypothetical protein
MELNKLDVYFSLDQAKFRCHACPLEKPGSAFRRVAQLATYKAPLRR